VYSRDRPQINNGITDIAEEYVPPTADAVRLFEQAGGTLTEDKGSGIDPLAIILHFANIVRHISAMGRLRSRILFGISM